ncbi:hypothetical protein FRB90_002111, partial [Tulasnella sp. 427]
MTSILPFLSPQLQTLDVELSGDSQTVNEFFTALAGRIPSLVTFILRTPTPARDVEDSLRRTIRTWTALETLELPPYYLRPSILETVTALPGLKALKQNYMHSPPVDQIAMLEQLPPTAFPVLEIFGFNGHPATSIRLIRDSEKLFSRLTSLHLNAVEGVGNANILELTSHVGEQCKHLEWLLLDLSLPAESPKEGISPLSHGVFENLLQCRRLREVQISHPYPVVFDASIVERMAAAWPKLTDFAITDVDLSLSIPDEWVNPLTVPELLELILSFASQSELVKSAIVCKFWSMLALDRLWKDLDSVFPLLELVVTRELLNVLDSSDADFVQRLSLALSRSDWSRFRSYANRVRSLSHDDTNHYRGNETPPCLTSVATALIYLHHPYGNFLPNIKELQWASSRSATSMVPFLSPELETLVIDLSGDSQSINELLNGLTWRTPKLKSFSFATSTPAIAVETSLQRAIRAWIELEDLAIPQYYLRPTILDVAAALPNLTALKQDYSSAPPTDETVTLQSLPPNAFPVLHTFGFNTQPAAAIRLIHQSERLFSRLTFLHINAVEGIGNAEILQLSRHIGEQCKQLNRLG